MEGEGISPFRKEDNMKGKVMTLQERRMLCKTVATSDNCLGDYYRLYRQAKKLYPANSYASEYSLTSFLEKELAKVLNKNYQQRKGQLNEHNSRSL